MLPLTCISCSREASFGSLGRCQHCGGILRPNYPAQAYEGLSSIVRGHGLDRYRALLPTEQPISNRGEGNTPLVLSHTIGPDLNLNKTYLKLEGSNPSGSFKDRPASLAVALAKQQKAKGILTASSGNAGSAIAAHAAAAGLPCLILLEPGNPATKLRQILLSGARVLPVEGIFSRHPDEISDLLIGLTARMEYYLAFVWAPVNPYLLEAIKTIAYEIFDQLGDAPDAVICPTGGGDMLTGIWRGFEDLEVAGLIDRRPRMIAVQPNAAPPLLKAYENRMEHVPELPSADSAISGINVSFSGDHGLFAIRDSAGAVVGLDDSEILETQRLLALREGIWVEPAGAAPIAALKRLQARGTLKSDDRVVCILSGAGFKDSHLAQATAEEVGRRDGIPFDLELILNELQTKG